jgi:opine dehydrogenase
MNVAVIGAGPGGLAFAGDLALAGATIALHDIDANRLTDTLRLRGAIEGEAAIALATTDPGAAVSGADAVVVVVPGPQLAAAVRAATPHVERGAVVVLATGGTGAALEAQAILGRSPAAVAEIDAFPYTCSLAPDGSVNVRSVKREYGVGVLGDVAGLTDLLPRARIAPSVLHTGLANFNSVLHVAPMVLNAGRIEAGERFEFYGDGITPAVAAVVAAYDAERLAVARALDLDVPSLSEWAARTYGVRENDAYALVQTLQREVYRALPAPTTLDHRFLSEDVPCGTVPVASLGALLGVAVPVHDATIAIASRLLGADLAATGRTVERLGLGGLDADGIRAAAGLP